MRRRRIMTVKGAVEMARYIMEASKIGYNARRLQAMAGDTAVWGVVKGNGYGLGTLTLADVLAENGIRRFAVTEPEDALLLREHFRDAEVLMLRGTCAEAEIRALLLGGVILSVGSGEELDAAARCGIPGRLHVQLDVGMGRFGFLPSEWETLARCFRVPGLTVTGMYTHFPTPDRKRQTLKQFRVFLETARRLRSMGLSPGMLHCCSSEAFWNWPEMRLDGVRLGSALLGRVPFAAEAGLAPAGYCEGRISGIRELPKGHPVGYGSTVRTCRRTRAAVIDVGHSCGFGLCNGPDAWRLGDCLRVAARSMWDWLVRRRLTVRVGNRECRVLGRIGMNATVIDVTDCPCRPGDPVRVELSPVRLRGLPVAEENGSTRKNLLQIPPAEGIIKEKTKGGNAI